MKKLTLITMTVFLLGSCFLLAQENPAGAQEEEKPALKPAAPYSFNPEGRRDPFKDLLGGSNVRERSADSQISVEDLILIGIIKDKAGFTAIVGTNQGFPDFVHVGDKFSDGYVLSITESQIVFRKTSDRGIPLVRPRDIIREITPEER
jgi:Tfp pilus assembly protein PilP